MPAPRIFVSSTFYDLRYVRENLKFFIRTLGYEPVLSEEGAVFFDPTLHVQDACVADVPTCQIFVLIIGGRTGGAFAGTDKSITNAEYLEATRTKIPVFALVERPVLEQYRLYQSNQANPAVDATRITYPNVDSIRVFSFIDQVQSQGINNALVPFSDFEEIQAYLKQQWAGLMFRFLAKESEARRTGEVLASLRTATENIEFLTRQVANSVGGSIARVAIDLYDYMIKNEVVRDLAIWQLTPSPKGILTHPTLDDFCDQKIEVDSDEDGFSLTYGGPPYKLSKGRYERNKKDYKTVRSKLISMLKEKGYSVEQFVEGS
ncbi:MAG TPA: DUF4062 domain-containing protein [Steroidobacteraceae bacterium]|nr:DUF4062 domain-containing protein [Steroidobacteraceae bacterium]